MNSRIAPIEEWEKFFKKLQNRWSFILSILWLAILILTEIDWRFWLSNWEYGRTLYWFLIFDFLLFFCVSLGLFGWKWWQYSKLIGIKHSLLKIGGKMGFMWMALCDFLIIFALTLSYVDGIGCMGFFGILSQCDSFLVFFTESFSAYFAYIVISTLIVFPVLFWLTGLYLDRRKNKESIPLLFIILLVLVIIFCIWWIRWI